MAIIKGPFKFTGSIKGFSFYTVAGSDKVIMRTKGGPDPEEMKTDPKFAKGRLHQQEWAGTMKFSKGIRYALGETYCLADFNVSATWCGIGKKNDRIESITRSGRTSVDVFTLQGWT